MDLRHGCCLRSCTGSGGALREVKRSDSDRAVWWRRLACSRRALWWGGVRTVPGTVAAKVCAPKSSMSIPTQTSARHLRRPCRKRHSGKAHRTRRHLVDTNPNLPWARPDDAARSARIYRRPHANLGIGPFPTEGDRMPTSSTLASRPSPSVVRQLFRQPRVLRDDPRCHIDPGILGSIQVTDRGLADWMVPGKWSRAGRGHGPAGRVKRAVGLMEHRQER